MVLAQIQARQPIFGKSSFDRSVVIAFREANVSFRGSVLQGLGSQIGSRLAYTQQSEGQNLPERPIALWCNQERVGL